MKKLLVLLVAVLAFNLSNAQTYQYKFMGQKIIYKFTDSLLTVTTKQQVEEQQVKLIDKNERVSVYVSIESRLGKKFKYSIIKSRKERYVIQLISLDEFSGKSVEMLLLVKKIAE